MKILWLTDHLLPDPALALGKVPGPSGGWIDALAVALSQMSEIDLAIATNITDHSRMCKQINNVRYYTVPAHKKTVVRKTLSKPLISEYQHVVTDFQPDVIHIHGTEYFHGLLSGRGYINCPTLISIQGIIDACVRHYMGGISPSDIIMSRTLRDWIRLDGLFEQKMRWANHAIDEREIFTSNVAFTGRTLWDRAHTRRLNPNAIYFHCDRLLRPPFYEDRWDLSGVKRHSIFAPSASYPLKGFHVLIKAASLLRKEFPDVTVRTPLAKFYPKVAGWPLFWKNCRSMGYARYLTKLIRDKKLEENIIPLGVLDAESMAHELQRSHVFVLPSLIENSPNALAEAMLIGAPVVASFVGGVQSMVQDGHTALCFPAGDEAVLAEQIRRIFLDDDQALRLSEAAHTVAVARHEKDKIVNQMVSIYRDVIAAWKVSQPILSTSLESE